MKEKNASAFSITNMRTELSIKTNYGLFLLFFLPLRFYSALCIVSFSMKAFFETYLFSEGGCIAYIYGGCRGTANLFDTKEKCEAKCLKPDTKSADVCQLKIDGGKDL